MLAIIVPVTGPNRPPTEPVIPVSIHLPFAKKSIVGTLEVVLNTKEKFLHVSSLIGVLPLDGKLKLVKPTDPERRVTSK